MKVTRSKGQDARTTGIARSAMASLAACGVALVLWIAMGTAAGQGMNDPTRPPTGIAAGVGDMDAADAGGGMMLQSVIISPTSKAAIISGVLVKLGEKYGDAVLVKVAENEVVLKSGTTSQVLKLYPGVDRSDAAPADAKNAPRRSKPRGTNTPAADGGASPR